MKAGGDALGAMLDEGACAAMLGAGRGKAIGSRRGPMGCGGVGRWRRGFANGGAGLQMGGERGKIVLFWGGDGVDMERGGQMWGERGRFGVWGSNVGGI